MPITSISYQELIDIYKYFELPLGCKDHKKVKKVFNNFNLRLHPDKDPTAAGRASPEFLEFIRNKGILEEFLDGKTVVTDSLLQQDRNLDSTHFDFLTRTIAGHFLTRHKSGYFEQSLAEMALYSSDTRRQTYLSKVDPRFFRYNIISGHYHYYLTDQGKKFFAKAVIKNLEILMSHISLGITNEDALAFKKQLLATHAPKGKVNLNSSEFDVSELMYIYYLLTINEIELDKIEGDEGYSSIHSKATYAMENKLYWFMGTMLFYATSILPLLLSLPTLLHFSYPVLFTIFGTSVTLPFMPFLIGFSLFALVIGYDFIKHVCFNHYKSIDSSKAILLEMIKIQKSFNSKVNVLYLQEKLKIALDGKYSNNLMIAFVAQCVLALSTVIALNIFTTPLLATILVSLNISAALTTAVLSLVYLKHLYKTKDIRGVERSFKIFMHSFFITAPNTEDVAPKTQEEFQQEFISRMKPLRFFPGLSAPQHGSDEPNPTPTEQRVQRASC